MAGQFGYAAQLGIDTANPVTVRFDLQNESLVLDEEFKDTNGLRGTTARSIERLRQGNRRVHGQIRMQPTAVEWSNLLPWIMGGSPTGSGTVTYPLADTRATRYVTVDRGPKVPTYNGVAVTRASLHGSQGEPLELTLELIGIDETLGNSGTFPSLSLDVSTGPFMFTDGVFSINSTTVQARDIEISWDFQIDANRFFNSQTLTATISQDRHVKLSTTLPYGDWSALYGTGVGGVAGTFTFTGSGTSVLTLTVTKVAFPRKSPSYEAGRAEEMLKLPGDCYKSGSTLETIVTLHT